MFVPATCCAEAGAWRPISISRVVSHAATALQEIQWCRYLIGFPIG
jgi:hypothetical protein